MKQPPRSVVNGTALLLVAIGLYLVTIILIKGCDRQTDDSTVTESNSTGTVNSITILDKSNNDTLKMEKSTNSRRSRSVKSKKATGKTKKGETENVYSPLDNRHN